MARRNHKPTTRTRETLNGDLLDLSPAETAAIAQTRWQGLHLLDDLDTHALRRDLTMFLTACQDLDLTTYAAVLDNLSPVIAEASGIKTSQFLSAKDSHEQFRVRNHLAAVLAATAMEFGNNPVLVLEHLPTPHPRAGGVHRPCADDEILLLRHRALAAVAQRGRSLLAGFQYMLVESGAMPIEAASVHPRSLDDLRQPTQFSLPGATFHSARDITLPRWARSPFAAAVDAHLANGTEAVRRPLCYVGQSGASATVSASASAMLRRTMIGAGLTEDCVVPKSVVKWRVQTTEKAAGSAAAMALLGKDDPAQVHYFLVGHSRDKAKKANDGKESKAEQRKANLWAALAS